jgi:arsenate reductase (glutaredoxin)
LLDHGAELDSRDLDKEPLNEDELNALIGTRDYKQFLNPRNELFRTKGMAEKPPPRTEAIRLMAQTPNLIRRPVVIRGEHIVLGFDEAAYKKLLKTA